MSENSKIEWTNHTFNPWIGCTHASPGCANCYAEVIAHHFKTAEWGPKAARVMLSDGNWAKPLKWQRDAAKAGTPAFVFCGSMCDWAEDRPELVEPRARLFRLIGQTPDLIWQLLTKRPENIMRLVPESWRARFPSNVWVGTTVEDQRRAEQRIPILLKVPAAVRFLSCEPLLGLLELDRLQLSPLCERCVKLPLASAFDRTERCGCTYGSAGEPIDWRTLDWVICGGESGNGARPMHPDWARSLRYQCADAEVPFFFKQWGEWAPQVDLDDDGEAITERVVKVGKKVAGSLLDGVAHKAFPEAS